MKLNVKLIISFFVVALLVGFVGFFGITSNNTIQKNNQIGQEIRDLMEELDDILRDVLQLIGTENLDDYLEIKSNIENTRIEFDILHEKNDKIIDKFSEDFDENIDEFTKISNGIIAIHKEKLAQNRDFKEKATLEKAGRYNIRTPLFAIDNRQLTEVVGYMQYYSKETLYQYKDQKHLDVWIGSIEEVRNIVEGKAAAAAAAAAAALSEEEKNNLLNDLNSYERTAQDLGDIVIEQKKIETEELIKIEQLREIIDRLEESEERIVSTIRSESKSLAKNTTRTLLIIILTAFIVSVVLGLYIARSISKPITELKDVADKISKGNLAEPIKIKTRDEIGELAEVFDDMRYSLKRVIGEYERKFKLSEPIKSQEQTIPKQISKKGKKNART